MRVHVRNAGTEARARPARQDLGHARGVVHRALGEHQRERPPLACRDLDLQASDPIRPESDVQVGRPGSAPRAGQAGAELMPAANGTIESVIVNDLYLLWFSVSPHEADPMVAHDDRRATPWTPPTKR